jgi:DNA-binding response OmpR family regulator
MKHKIIVLDDNESILTVADDALTNAGFSVTTSSDSLNLHELLSGSTYDLLITDIFIPKKDGIDILTEVKENWPTMKVIAMSGGSELGDILSIAKELGADQILYKPFTLAELITKTKEVLILS